MNREAEHVEPDGDTLVDAWAWRRDNCTAQLETLEAEMCRLMQLDHEMYEPEVDKAGMPTGRNRYLCSLEQELVSFRMGLEGLDP